MRGTLLLDLVRTCSIPIFVLLGQGIEVRADSLRWNVFNPTNAKEDFRQVDWIDLPLLQQVPHDDQTTVFWSDVEGPNKSETPSNNVIWKVLPEKESNLSDEEIAEQTPKSPIKPVIIPPSQLQALDRSIAFEDGFVGPDISWDIPNGLRWAERWFGSTSLRTQNRQKNNKSIYQWSGGDTDFIVHANILQTASWSLGINTSIRSINTTQNSTGRNSEFGDGISNGFRVAKSLSNTAGIAFGGEQIVQWDDKTDTGRNLYLMVTKGWWLGMKGNSYPLLIANGGFGTGRYANSDIHKPWINPLRFACIEGFENRIETFAVDNDLCWSPMGSVSIIFNDYLSSFIEYRSGTASVAASVSMTDGIPLRLTWGVDFLQMNQVLAPDKFRWILKASIGF